MRTSRVAGLMPFVLMLSALLWAVEAPTYTSPKSDYPTPYEQAASVSGPAPKTVRPAGLGDFEPELKVYAEYYYRVDDAGDDENGFCLDKLYVGGKYVVDEDLLFRGCIGANQDGVFLKHAYVDWRPGITGENRLVFGVHGDPYLSTTQDIWGLRYVRRVLIDDVGIWSTGQFGLEYQRRFGRSYISARVTNGEGYRNSEDDKYKALQATVSLRPSEMAPELARGLGLDLVGIWNADDAGGVKDNEEIYAALASWRLDNVQIGCEYVRRQDGGGGEGFSTFLVADLGQEQKVKFFVRFDEFDPDKAILGNEHRLQMIGFEFRMYEGVRLALSFQREDNDTLGGGIVDKIALSTELKW